MPEVTPADVQQLRDDELRELVARLCAAELSRVGLSSSGVTSGGAQDEPDGGIDVRVSVEGPFAAGGWIPRRDTGFQVKVPPMPPKAVVAEMRPGGELRPSIVDLAERNGAYVIVSAKASLTDARLALTTTAMRNAFQGGRAQGQLAIDFYDRDRLARWVNTFPGVAAWILRTTGRAAEGWSPPEGLTADPPGAPFITADDCLLVDGRANGCALPLADGIARMRAALSEPKATLRLVGLSGLGKTRLVQALFEPEVGTGALDRAVGLYADQAAEPVPSPRRMATDLVRAGTCCILVVDNCTPETHRVLSETCRGQSSNVSLLTVEYDVRDDEPEGTEGCCQTNVAGQGTAC